MRLAGLFLSRRNPSAGTPFMVLYQAVIPLNKALRPAIFHDKMSKVALCLQGGLRPGQVYEYMWFQPLVEMTGMVKVYGMRFFFASLIAVMLIVAPAGIGFGGAYEGDYDVGSAANGIGFSRHNLGKYGGRTRTETTFDICVFCHTPHSPADKAGPIWSGRQAVTPSFTAYGTSMGKGKPSIAGLNAEGLGSPSLACLSCHDGSTAFDNIANSPGKKREMRKYVPGKWGFILNESKADPSLVSTRLMLGPLLTNDHPVNVLFRGGKYASLRNKNTVISQINLSAGLYMTNSFRLNNLWSIKGFISDTATIGDLLRDGRIECSSCHDPHFNNKSWSETAGRFIDWNDMDGLFLRRIGGNFSSGVCRTCHGK